SLHTRSTPVYNPCSFLCSTFTSLSLKAQCFSLLVAGSSRSLPSCVSVGIIVHFGNFMIQAWVCSAHLNMDSTENLFPGSGFQQNDGFTSNLTAVNTSLLYTSLLSPMMDKTINILMIVMLFITMVSLGCTMEVTKIKDHILKPKGVAIAVLSQYGIMPLTAFCLVK
ncbi:hypothetical protein ILYODFUR_036046, partial [Ilyodon furcidens]